MRSIWQDVRLPSYPQLRRALRTDVLIIGGGLAGLLIAYNLHRSGVRCVLVEQNRICSGNTRHTTAKLTLQHGLHYHKLIQTRGLDAARQYVAATQLALSQYAQLCSQIDCEYEQLDSVLYATSNPLQLEQELAAYEKLQLPGAWCSSTPLPVDIVGALRMPGQAQFHPLKFVRGLLDGLEIYEQTPVTDLDGTIAHTPTASIHADQIVCATHFPFLNRWGWYFVKLYQQRSYVLALENAAQLDGMYRDAAETGLSFRNSGDLLLLGGPSVRTGQEFQAWQPLQAFACRHYPGSSIVAQWAAQDCISLDHVPYIGQYGRRAERLWVATGFNKWGMTGSMVSALVLRDAVLGRPSAFPEIFLPSRRMERMPLAMNLLASARNLLSPSRKRCPHLGCALKWNPAEHSWDCPCHGSRFSEHGEVLDNPAKHGL